MVAQAGGYYGTAFQGERGLTQGDPLPPTIFNVMVGAVVQHWVELMVEVSEERGKRRQTALFYRGDGMVTLLDPHWIQGAFDTLVGLFDRVSLRINVGKTVVMVCRPFQAVGNQSEATCGRRITGEVPT